MPEDDEKAGNIKPLYESLALALAERSKELASVSGGFEQIQKENEMALIGLQKYVAGEWDQEQYPEEIQWKHALEHQLKRLLTMSDGADPDLPRLKNTVRTLFPYIQ